MSSENAQIHSANEEASGGPRRPQEAPGGSRRLQEAPGGFRRLQEAPGGSRRLQDGQKCETFVKTRGRRPKVDDSFALWSKRALASLGRPWAALGGLGQPWADLGSLGWPWPA